MSESSSKPIAPLPRMHPLFVVGLISIDLIGIQGGSKPNRSAWNVGTKLKLKMRCMRSRSTTYFLAALWRPKRGSRGCRRRINESYCHVLEDDKRPLNKYLTRRPSNLPLLRISSLSFSWALLLASPPTGYWCHHVSGLDLIIVATNCLPVLGAHTPRRKLLT